MSARSAAAPPPDGASPVRGWLPHPSLTDFPGRLAPVLFVSGCNFRCGFCHNAALLGAPQPGVSWGELDIFCRKMRREWADGVVVSGGEPTLAPELETLLRRLRGYGWAVKLDTNGSRPDALERALPLVDYVAMDIKCAPEDYPALTGFSDTDRIRDSIALIKARAADYEFRTTVLETFHTADDLAALRPWLAGARRYVLQPFVPRAHLPDETWSTAPRTSPARLRVLGEIFRDCVDELRLETGAVPDLHYRRRAGSPAHLPRRE